MSIPQNLRTVKKICEHKDAAGLTEAPRGLPSVNHISRRTNLDKLTEDPVSWARIVELADIRARLERD